ncbi:hypothetical protein [Paenibacillus hamazuiensis]|uniref:golvesin C-terminal-like domain-containing protein n=1 Tax=Paenibacillus hamazuiensis TaxID=2936508 RepID=UPI00200EDF05|nr:hypothetical protein [Paenibacillus hamazuiensis]
MKSLGRKILTAFMMICIFLGSSIAAYAASTVIVYDGGTGWSSKGILRTSSSCGYDGKMQYVDQDGSVHYSSSGLWYLNPTGSGVDDFYVYIPSCNSSASVVYYVWDGDGNNFAFNVNQRSYINIWYFLGSHYVKPGGGQSIALGTSEVNSGIVGFDEVKFVN